MEPIREKDPRCVAAGKRNQQKRGPWTAEQRERVRQAIYKTRPWEKSTGPRTQAGKTRSAANGPNHRRKRKKKLSAVADANTLVAQMAALRKQVVG